MNEQNQTLKRKQHDRSRRHFLTSMGALAAGAAVGSFAMAGVATASPQEAPSLPWVYKPLDPVKVGKLAVLLGGGMLRQRRRQADPV